MEFLKSLALFSYSFSFFFLLSQLNTVFGDTDPPTLPIKGVNLGGWLVTEGWITPYLFNGIENGDLLDGTQINIKSSFTGKFLCAEDGGGNTLVANRDKADKWETFRLWRVDATHFYLRANSKQFVGIGAGGEAVVTAGTPGIAETFEIKRGKNKEYVRIKASNGYLLQVKADNSLAADLVDSGSWLNERASVFHMTVVKGMQGEYQLTNALGPEGAQRVLKEHWATYITEDDFKFIKDNGLNAVRIPVGWWIASDPSPPSPYVGGSLAALDNAFSWADTHGLKVIVDLHAAPGSQSRYDHSGGRDGHVEWGTGDTVAQTVAAIDFLAQRYANHGSLLAVELINEPTAPAVSFETLKNYYQDGYDALRKYTSSAYVIFSSRLFADDATEYIPFAAALDRTVLDVHYYNLYTEYFDKMMPQEHLDYVRRERPKQLAAITKPNGFPLSFVGEWSAALPAKAAGKGYGQMYAKAQLEVFERASFGWAFWTYKNMANGWSLQKMLQNGEISIP